MYTNALLSQIHVDVQNIFEFIQKGSLEKYDKFHKQDATN